MYDGTTSPVVFAEYFRLQAIYQDWDNDKACLVLPLFLRGNAKKVFAAFNPKTSIEDLLAEIIDKCSQPQEFLLNEFFNRKQHAGESVSQFAAALAVLLQAADPTMPEINATKLLKAQLSNSLPDHTRELINFNEALTWTQLLRNLDKSGPRVPVADGQLSLIKSEPVEVNWLSSQADQGRPRYPSSNPRVDSNGNQGNRFNGTCHYCHRFGHREFECRTKVRDSMASQMRFDDNQSNSYNNDDRGSNLYNRGNSNHSRVSTNRFNINTSSNNRGFHNNSSFRNNDRTFRSNTGSNDRGLNPAQTSANANGLDTQLDEFPFFADTAAVEISSLEPATPLLKSYVQAVIFGQPQIQVLALIDGGSSHSFISPTILTPVQIKIAGDRTNKLAQIRNFIITSATTKIKSACCVTTVQLKVGSWAGDHAFVISGAVNKHEMIIGRDFFVKHKVIVDHAHESMIIDGTDIKLNAVEVIPCILGIKEQGEIRRGKDPVDHQLTSILNKLNDLMNEKTRNKLEQEKAIEPPVNLPIKSGTTDLFTPQL
jgi:hypothetical protein